MAWDKVLRDKQCGGLGIGSLRALNLALLVKWRWRQKIEPNATWNKVVSSCNGRLPPGQAHNHNRGTWNTIIGVDRDLADLGINVGNLLKPKEDGSGWVWELESSKEYTVKSMRRLLDSVMLPLADAATEWIRWIPSKSNIFLWRVLSNRLPTRDNLQKRGVVMVTGECPLCNTEMECLNHLMTTCSTAKIISAHMANWVDWWPINRVTIEDLWEAIREEGSKVKHEDVYKVIGAAYLKVIWNSRNNKVFNGELKKEIDIAREIKNVAFDWVRCRCRGGKSLSWDFWLCNPALAVDSCTF